MPHLRRSSWASCHLWVKPGVHAHALLLLAGRPSNLNRLPAGAKPGQAAKLLHVEGPQMSERRAVAG
jgi:hypothetical protein